MSRREPRMRASPPSGGSSNLMTVEGDMINRAEFFDDTDIDAAIARFDELSRPAQRLENAASRVVERYLADFATHDWDAMAELLAENFLGDDRRHVVNDGGRSGRDAEIANVRVIAEIGCADITSIPHRYPGRPSRPLPVTLPPGPIGPEPLVIDTIDVVEINADNQIAAQIAFDPDDIDAAFEELDARYLAGEAAPYAQTWSAVAEAYACVRRGELPR